MFSHFFIERPIFAAVLSIVITLAGTVAVLNLPVAQYPAITPPSIMVMCNYPGANAQVVADSVAAPIEQQVNGVEDMLYMVSQSNNDGSYTLTVTFKPGVNLNFAQVLVQNRINLALPLLPDVVKQAGVTTRKRNPDILMVVAIYSPNGRYDQMYLSNFTTIKLRDEVARVDGVGDCMQFGQQDYSMRIWVDPDRLAALKMTASDVVNALRQENRQVASGHLGQQPTSPGQRFEFTISTLGRLTTPEEFGEVVLTSDAEGRKVRIKDVVSRPPENGPRRLGYGVELGARNLDSSSTIDARPNASLAIFALPTANAIATAQRVRDRMDELKKNFPEDIDYTISLDMTPFITESIHEVIRTLAEAIVLVAAVVLIFLQNWRSALIPLVAVPVSIIGTFAVMAAIGFSLNTLTLFGLVLAIGIVVDDAIVVVEAVEHLIEQGMSPRQAAHKAMEQVSGPVLAVAFVLSAVFLPCAFISGITGQFFRQFALTIAVSTVISAFNSLTLSPALAAILLPARGQKKDLLGRLLDLTLGWFFRLFNWGFRHSTNFYANVVGLALRGSLLVLIVYGGLLVLTWWTSTRLPIGYIPNQDQGRFYVAVQLPDASSLQRTQKVINHITRLIQQVEGVNHVTGIAGQSFTLNANGSNFGQFFVTLKEFDQRRHPIPDPDDPTGQRKLEMSANAITDRVRGMLAREVPEAMVSLFTPPPVSGLGSASGFKIIIEDRGDLGIVELQKQIERLMAAGNAGHFLLTEKSLAALHAGHDVPEEVLARLDHLKDHDFLTGDLFRKAVGDVLTEANVSSKAERDRIGKLVQEQAENRKVVGNLFSVFRANTPQLFVNVNREQCQAMDVNPRDVFNTLQIYLGSYYVNDFNRFGRTWQVVVQASGEQRDNLDKIKLLQVRSAHGYMVPLGTLLTVKEIGGPINIGRYNMYTAAAILGATMGDVSSGQGIEEMERLCAEVLPPGMSFEWTEINYMQVLASQNIWNNLIFPLAVVFVFLVLAAQYESWALPLAVILVVPMCILGSLTGVAVTKTDINIFTQIGFVVLVGLASKNAILIVEYAKHKRESGLPRDEATLEACRLRLRPILMTSFAFILGVVPLLVAHGAGAEMRRTLGTAVFSGMLGVTLFGIFLTPVFFYVIEGFVEVPLFSSARAKQFSWVMLFVVGILTMGLLWLIPWALGRATRRPIPVGVPVGKTVVIVPPPVPAHDTVLDHHHDTVLVNGNGAAKANGIESPGVNGGPHHGTLERNGHTRTEPTEEVAAPEVVERVGKNTPE